MSQLPPAAKKPKLSPEEKQISDLSDADLAAVFQRLPPFDRLIASEVCRRWYALSRKEWLDVNYLDLNLIPGKHIAAILRQSPNLRSVFAVKKSFGLRDLASLAKSRQLSTVKLYDCCFAYQSVSDPRFFNVDFEDVFSQQLQHAPWHELILHNSLLDDKAVTGDRISFRESLSLACLPASLTRLQLTGLRLRKGTRYFYHPFLFVLEDRLQNLECLILHDTPEASAGTAEDSVDLLGTAWDYHCLIFSKICALKNLTELCLGPAHSLSPTRRMCSAARFGRLMSGLPKLAVLFLGQVDVEMLANEFAKLITGNAVLRILVLAGSTYRPVQAPGEPDLEPIELPARKRFPHGFGSDPLPLLHVFVGKSASEHLRFAQSVSDAALIHYIDAPMPEFLEEKDIAPIFEGCWIAEKIKETARSGGKLWEFESDACSNFGPHS